MSELSESRAHEEDSDTQRPDETFDKMSIAELFELLIDIENRIRQASSLPDSM